MRDIKDDLKMRADARRKIVIARDGLSAWRMPEKVVPSAKEKERRRPRNSRPRDQWRWEWDG